MKTATNHEAEARHAYGESVELRVSEVRAASDESLTVSGYAAMFDDITDLGYFRERIARGAFDGVMEDDVRLLINHTGVPLARTTNGTLDLEVDGSGLRYTARLADTQEGRDLYKLIKRGDISQSSFAFTIEEEDWDRKANLRTITRMGSLLDVSPVTYPAYPTTTVAARMAAAAVDPAEEQVDEVAEEVVAAIEEVALPEPEPQPEKLERTTFAHINTQTMNLNELKALRAKHYEEHVALVENPEKEGRTITEAEEQRAAWLVGEVEALDKRIKHRADHEKMVARMVGGEAPSRGEEREIAKMNGQFSLSRAVLTAANGRALEGIEAEWAQEAQREMRAQGLQAVGQVAIPTKALYRGAADNFTATIGNGDGEGFVPINVGGAIGSLIAPAVIERLGTTVINGATGNLKFPRVSVAPAGTAEGEVDANAASGMEMDELTLSPQRVSAKTTYSKQLLLQGGAAVDLVIAQELNAAMNKFIDTKAFDTLDGATMNDLTTAGAGNTVMNAALAVAMEAAVLADGADLANCYYVMSPYAYQLAKNAAQVSSVSALYDLATNTFNGYRAIATPYLTDISGTVGQMLFGNFQQGAILAYFGGIDLLVDPYSAAGNAQIVLHVNRFFDFDLRQANALAKCNDVAAS